jgi:hypothetical protein
LGRGSYSIRVAPLRNAAGDMPGLDGLMEMLKKQDIPPPIFGWRPWKKIF